MPLLRDAVEADDIHFRLPDGRILAFDEDAAQRHYASYYARWSDRVATAREIFEGTVSGTGYYLFEEEAAALGMHALVEVYDWHLKDDNGRVIAEQKRTQKLLSPDTMVLVEDLERHPRQRHLPEPRTPPQTITLASEPLLTKPCANGGEILLVEHANALLACWRRDKRYIHDIRVLSLHDVELAAMKAVHEAAEGYHPPRKRPTRAKDYQRGKVYDWELRCKTLSRRFDTIEECRAYLTEVCDDLGVVPPQISHGSAKLENYSYYNRLKGIVLQEGMKTARTIIHELSHYLHREVHRSRNVAHGPDFVGIYAGLMARFLSADLDQCLQEARDLHIDVDEAMAHLYAGTCDHEEKPASPGFH